MNFKDRCLGFLIDQTGAKYRVYLPLQPSFDSQSEETISLQSLLSQPHPLGRIDRLKLGLKLAMSVMQLQNTGWLNERWSKKDIVFFRDSNDHGKVKLEYPMLRQVFSASSNSSTADSVTAYDKRLISLGIILLELWLWKPLEEFCRLEDGIEPCSWSDTKACDVARNAYKMHLSQDAVPKYSEVVWLCLVGLGHGKPDWTSNEFKADVWKRIISPLAGLV